MLVCCDSSFVHNNFKVSNDVMASVCNVINCYQASVIATVWMTLYILAVRGYKSTRLYVAIKPFMH